MTTYIKTETCSCWDKLCKKPLNDINVANCVWLYFTHIMILLIVFDCTLPILWSYSLCLIANDYLALGHSGACVQRMHQMLSHSKCLHFTHEVNSRIQQRTIVPSSIMNNSVFLMEMQCFYFEGRNQIQIYYLTL